MHKRLILLCKEQKCSRDKKFNHLQEISKNASSEETQVRAKRCVDNIYDDWLDEAETMVSNNTRRRQQSAGPSSDIALSDSSDEE